MKKNVQKYYTYINSADLYLKKWKKIMETTSIQLLESMYDMQYAAENKAPQHQQCLGF